MSPPSKLVEPDSTRHPIPPTPSTATPTEMATLSSPPDPPSPNLPSPFARPRSRPTSPTLIAYWTRLSHLLRDTQAAVSSLQPQASIQPNKGWQGVVATHLQGLSASLLATKVKIESKNASDWKQAYEAGGLGQFVTYGVADLFAAWIATKLVHYGWEKPQVADCVEEHTTATDEAVEAVRVRVWEAEPAYLSVEVSEKILVARKRLRRYKNRVDLCVKIVAALEGKGRKISPAALEKTKLMLEKADQMHLKEEERLKAAEERERERERQRERKARAKEEKRLQKTKITEKKARLEKKKRQESAQAMFMKNFVKRKPTPASNVNAVEVVYLDAQEVDGNTITTQDSLNSLDGMLPVAADKDVMSNSWWLLSVMDAPAFDELDRSLKPVTEPVDPSQPSVDIDMRYHITRCAERRKEAERRIHKALLEYRRTRTQHLEDRTPRFTNKRADSRGRCDGSPVKLLQFDENHRPAFFGTDTRRVGAVKPRRPFAKDAALDYSYDSADDWEDEEEGEDILDLEADKEQASEDAELRMLYGSDEEDDDDFLDDGDVEDEEVDGDDSDSADMDVDDSTRTDDKAAKISPGSSPRCKKGSSQDSAVVDLTEAVPGSGKKKVRGPKSAGGDGPMRKKRRRNSFKVVIQGVSIPTPGVASPLDCHPVTMIDGAPRITMFNPYVTHVSHYIQENSPPRPVPIRIPRTNLDEGAKLDLAVAIVTTQERTSRDAIVYKFCEGRRSRGLPVPPKSEVVRAIRVLATNEKRAGDSRAGWYLSDASLAVKVRAMNLNSGQTHALGASSLGGTERHPVTNVQIVAERIAEAAAKAARDIVIMKRAPELAKPGQSSAALEGSVKGSVMGPNGASGGSNAAVNVEDISAAMKDIASVAVSKGKGLASEEQNAEMFMKRKEVSASLKKAESDAHVMVGGCASTLAK